MSLLTAVFRDNLTIILILLRTVQSGWGVLVKPGVAVITSIDDSENHLSVKYIVDIFPTGTSTVWFGFERATVDGISSIFAHMGCEENRQLVTEDILGTS